jgi:uncharacterized protein (TIGR03437 family)
MGNSRVSVWRMIRTGSSLALLAIAWGGSGTWAQTLNNQSLSGKYFFRQVSLGTDLSGNITDPRSIIGTITFTGTAGIYNFSGQEVTGSSGGALPQGGSGTYSVDAGGSVVMDSPLRPLDKLNARLGPEALVGSNTESSDNTFDILVAIPAPAGGTTASITGSGPYWAATLEFPGGVNTYARTTLFNFSPGELDTIAPFNVNGHAANISSGLPASQTVSGASYLVNADGTGSINLGSSSNSVLLSGSRTLYVSADGNLLLGGSTAAGSHDILIAVRAISGATSSSWNGTFWSAGLRLDSSQSPSVLDYAGSARASAGSLSLSRRLNALGQGPADFTAVTSYALNSDGSGTLPLTLMALGAAGKAFLSVTADASDPTAFELDFGVPPYTLSGTGIFLNPLAVLNAASFAPPGAPISPGQFLTLYVTGITKTAQTGTPPYPTTLNGITVLFNNIAAPIYFAGPSGSQFQINCLVPYATTGATAGIVVQSGGASSNTVTVPVAATSPGVYSLTSNGTGNGAILHVDYTEVTTAKPAQASETVLIYLTGLGAVTPAVADGTAAGSNPLSVTANAPLVYIGDEQAHVLYSSMAPGFPGLYQINVTLPPYFPSTGNLPLAISTVNAYTDQVYIPVH